MNKEFAKALSKENADIAIEVAKDYGYDVGWFWRKLDAESINKKGKWKRRNIVKSKYYLKPDLCHFYPTKINGALPNSFQWYRDVVEPSRKELEKNLKKHTRKEKKMRNFEKYETEIKEALGNGELFSVVEKLGVKKGYSTFEIVRWLYEEYKEPLSSILNHFEKSSIREMYLSKFVENLKKEKNIKITVDVDGCICFLVNDNTFFSTSYMPHDQTEYGDKRLECGKYYSLEELGLND